MRIHATFLFGFISLVSTSPAQISGVAAQSAVVNVMQLAAEEAASGPALRLHALRRPARRHRPTTPLLPRIIPGLPALPRTAARDSYTMRDAATAPAVTMNGFPGVADDLTAVPPDTTGAAGPQHVVTMLNSRVQFQTRAGAMLGSMTLGKFWSALPSTDDVTDPRILYDPFGKRWLASALSIVDTPTSALLVGASQSADPTGNWSLFRIPIDSKHLMDGDYDVLSFNSTWVVVSVDVFKGPEYQVTNLYLFSKADLYSGKSGTYRVFNNFYGPFVPATDYDNLPKRMFLLQEDFGYFAGLIVSEIQGDVGAEVFLSERGYVKPPDLWDVAPHDSLEFAPQLGSSDKIETNDSRLQNCILRNGSIWCTQTIFLPVNNPKRTAVQWWQISPDRYQILQRGRIDDPTGATFYAFPSIAVNKNNDVVVGYNRFAANQYASANFSFRSAADPPGVMQQDTVFKAGEAPYKAKLVPDNRWGDYSMTVVDPVDDLGFWTLQEYAASPGTDAAPRWGTWWAQIMPLGAGKTCAWTLSRSTQTFTSAGGTGSVDVATTAGCNWMAAANASWITLSAGGNGNAAGAVSYTVAANPAGTARTATVSIAGQSVTITEAAAPPAPDLLITDLKAPTTAIVGGQIAVTSTVRNQGTLVAAAFRVGFYFSAIAATTAQDIFSGSSCTIDQGLRAAASAPCNLQVTVPATLKPGSYFLRAVADDQNALTENDRTNNARLADSGPIDVQAAVVPPPLPVFTASGVLNLASFKSGAVAPGESVVFSGQNMGPVDAQASLSFETLVAGTRVLFDGIAAPLRSVSDKSVSAIVPFEVLPGGLTQVVIEYKGTRSAAVSVPVVDSAPAIFTADGSGQGQGKIANADGMPNSADLPAAPLSVVTFNVTGAGQTDPLGVDGQLTQDPAPRLLLPVTATIAGLDARVVAAGPMPGLVNGTIQVSLEVPADAQPDPAAAVVVTVGTAPTPPVTMAIGPAN